MPEPTDGGVDTQASEGNSEAPDVTAQIADVVKAQVAEALAPLRDDVETVRRNKLDSRNKKLNDEIKARDEELANLRSRLEQLDPEKVDTKDRMLATLTADFQQQVEQHKKLQQEFLEAQSRLRRKDLEDLVLGDVAPEHRETALDLMEGTLHRKSIDINDPETDLQSVANVLRERIKTTLSVPAARASGEVNSKRPESQEKIVDWSTFTSWDQVPPEAKAAGVPPDVFDRLVPRKERAGGGTSGIGL